MERSSSSGSILMGTVWMAVISLVLFWLPVLGPLLAGVVGGKVAGGVGRAILAFFLPGLVLALCLTFFAGFVTGLPFFGFLAGLGTLALTGIGAGPMIVGAIVGGLLADG